MLTPYGEIPDRLAAGMSLAEQHDWLAVRASRRTVLRGLVVAGAGTSPLLWQRGARAAADVRVIGRLLVPGADPTRELTVGIAVPDSFRSGRVEATAVGGSGGTQGDLEVQAVRGTAVRYGRATLSGLAPGTDYSYTVVLDGVKASEGTFRTAPAGAAPFRFTAFGDQGVGGNAKNVLRRIEAAKPAFHLFAGDICYANQNGDGGGGDFRPQLWDQWLVQNDAVTRSVPFLCTVGNHEMEPGFGTYGYAGVLSRIPLPGRKPMNLPASWAVQHGTVGIVGLDSNEASYEFPRNFGYSRGAQTKWLQSTLAGFRAEGSGVEFVVAVLHHSPYSTNESHASEGGVRQQWTPVFDEYGVDLVISGHNHCYERTLPIRAGQVTGQDTDAIDSADGTTYVTAGGGGANSTPQFIREGLTRLYTNDGPAVERVDWALPERTGAHGLLVVDVQPGGRVGATSTMTIKAVGEQGETLDSVVLRRPATVAMADPEPVAASSSADDGSSREATVLTGLAIAGGLAAVAAGTAATIMVRRRTAEKNEPLPEPPPSRVVVRRLLDTPDASLDPPTEQIRFDPSALDEPTQTIRYEPLVPPRGATAAWPPRPARPQPAEPSAEEPARQQAKPKPVQPVQPQPVQPEPVQPKPVQPKPAQPKPGKPDPVQPKPVVPAKPTIRSMPPEKRVSPPMRPHPRPLERYRDPDSPSEDVTTQMAALPEPDPEPEADVTTQLAAIPEPESESATEDPEPAEEPQPEPEADVTTQLTALPEPEDPKK